MEKASKRSTQHTAGGMTAALEQDMVLVSPLSLSLEGQRRILLAARTVAELYKYVRMSWMCCLRGCRAALGVICMVRALGRGSNVVISMSFFLRVPLPSLDRGDKLFTCLFSVWSLRRVQTVHAEKAGGEGMTNETKTCFDYL